MSFKLHVRLIEARGLPKMDVMSKTDPYCVLYSTQSPKKQRSRTKSNTHTPVWNEDFHFTISNPSHDQLFIELFDEDVFFDDPFARFSLSVSTLQLGKIVDMWYDLLPVKRVKKAGQIHLLLHLAHATDTPFVMAVNSPTPAMPPQQPVYIQQQQAYPAYQQPPPQPMYAASPQPVYAQPMYAPPPQQPPMMYPQQPMMPPQQPQMMYPQQPQPPQMLYPQPATVPPPQQMMYQPAYQAQLQPQFIQQPGKPMYVQGNVNVSDAKRMALNQARGGY